LIRRIFSFLVLIIFFFPIFFLITSSFKSSKDIFTLPPKLLFFDIDFSVYDKVFGISTLFNFNNSFLEALNSHLFLTSRIIDSFIIAISSSSITLIISVYAGYCISRINFKYRNLIIFSIISSRMMPLISIAIPIYFVYEKINLIDTYIGIIFVHAFINLPLAILLLKSFFDEIPKQIDENAFLDGANRIEILHKIILPNTLGGLSVTFILSFIFSWTEFICAVMLGQMNVKTVPVQASILKTIPTWEYMAAFTTISIIPVFILVLLVKKHLVRGITLGTIKE